MLQLCNIARSILRKVVFCNLSHSGTSKMCLSRIYHSNLFNFPGLFVLVTCFLVFSVWLFATTRCKSTLRHCTVFLLKWPVHDLVLAIPPPLLIKVAAIYKTMLKTWRNNFEWRRGGRSVLYGISQTCY